MDSEVDTDAVADRAQINEVADFLAAFKPELLRELFNKTGLEDLGGPSPVMGPSSQANILREKAHVIERVLPEIALSCSAGAERMRSRRRQGQMVAFWSDVTTTISGSAVLALIIRNHPAWALAPGALSLGGSILGLISKRHVVISKGSGRTDYDSVARRLDEIAFDARRTAEELGVYLRLGADVRALRTLITKGNGLARCVNVDLREYVRLPPP